MLKAIPAWSRLGASSLGAILSLSLPVLAQDVKITDALPKVDIAIAGKSVTITRSHEAASRISGELDWTSRDCPPACIQPMKALRNVETIGELEVIDFLRKDVAGTGGALIDVRLPDLFAKGSIPGAVNVPYTTLDPENPYFNDILSALGGKPAGGNTFDFAGAISIVLFCNGPWSDQSVRAVRALREAGYPADKMKYYRGGMQDWLMLGLSSTAQTGIAGGNP